MENLMKFTKIVSKLAITLLISMHITSFCMNNMNKKSEPAFIKIKDEKINFTIKDISPDCKYAVSVPTDQKLVIYKLDDLSVVREYKQMDEPAKLDTRFYQAIVKFSPCGDYVITGSQGAVILYGVHSEQQDVLYKHPNSIRCIDFSSNGTHIASIDDYGFIVVYDMVKREEVCQYNHDDKNIYKGAIQSFCISPDGNFVASGSSNGAFTLYDIENRKKIYEPQTNLEITCICFSKDSRYIFFAGGQHYPLMIIYDISAEKKLLEHRDAWKDKWKTHTITSAYFNHDNSLLAVGDSNSLVLVYDISNPKKVEKNDKFSIGGRGLHIRKLRFCPDNRYLFARGMYSAIRNIKKKENVFDRNDNNNTIHAIRLSPEYDKIVSFDRNRNWHRGGNTSLKTFKVNPSHDFYKHNRLFSPLEKEDKAERITLAKEEENLYRENNQRKDCIKLYIGSEKFNVSKIFLLM